MKGTFYGIGVGNGDPENLTLKAVRLLGGLDTLIAPVSREGRDSLAYEIVRQHVPERTAVIFRWFPMTKDAEAADTVINATAAEIEERVDRGEKVGFVTLGDPMLYSTFIRLYKKLSGKEIPMVSVPGIMSFGAAASKSGFPLAEQDEVIAVIPSARHDDLHRLLPLVDAAVILKASGDCRELVKSLDQAGMAQNAVFVSRLDLEREMITRDLQQLDGMKTDYLSMILARKKEA